MTISNLANLDLIEITKLQLKDERLKLELKTQAEKKEEPTVKPEPKATENSSKQAEETKKETDPFVAALRMAIENDGKVDAKELKHLKSLEEDTSELKPEKISVRECIERANLPTIRQVLFGDVFIVSNLNFYWESTTVVSYTEYEAPKQKPKPKFTNDHSLREAFKIAALDGLIDENEIKLLKELYGGKQENKVQEMAVDNEEKVENKNTDKEIIIDTNIKNTDKNERELDLKPSIEDPSLRIYV